MHRKLFAVIAAFVLLAGVSSVLADGFEIGVGANYWYSIEEVEDQAFDRDGLGWMITSRVPLAKYLAIGLEIEQTPENFAFLEDKLYMPAAYAILGRGIYIGLGVGTYYYDGDFYSDVWYALRAGLEVPILTRHLVLDVNVNYRVEEWSGIKEADDFVDSDTLMIGAAIRLAF